MVAISETFYDILFRKGKPVAACPGGAMLNSAVSLGRAGIPVELVSEFGGDFLGDTICEFLQENNVSTQYVTRYDNRKSPLALALLDSASNAHYSFYEDFPPERELKFNMNLKGDDILMFGSILACLEPLSEGLDRILARASRAGTTVLYDPNIRKDLIPDIDSIRHLIDNNIRRADIIRASDEDMLSIGGCRNADEAYEYVLDSGCDCLVYTTSGRGAYLRTPALSKYYSTPDIEAISTVGAGDSFNAGIVYTLCRKSIGREHLRNILVDTWDRIIGNGIGFATDVCMSTDNYISREYALRLVS